MHSLVKIRQSSRHTFCFSREEIITSYHFYSYHYILKFPKYTKLAGLWFSPGTTVSSTNKTGLRDITELLLKVASGIKHHKYHRVIGFRAIIDFHI
jgi:hypothetical protein